MLTDPDGQGEELHPDVRIVLTHLLDRFLTKKTTTSSEKSVINGQIVCGKWRNVIPRGDNPTWCGAILERKQMDATSTSRYSVLCCQNNHGHTPKRQHKSPASRHQIPTNTFMTCPNGGFDLDNSIRISGSLQVTSSVTVSFTSKVFGDICSPMRETQQSCCHKRENILNMDHV